MEPDRPRRSRAGQYEAEFGELPPPKRARATKAQAEGTPAAGGSKGPGRRYVAPESHRPHGSYAKYVIERCRCEACTAANAAYERRRRRAIARPDEVWLPLVPARAVRRHLAKLRAAGLGLPTVAALSGVSHGALAKIVRGDPARGRRPTRRVRPETLAAVLAVQVEDARGGQRVPAGPTWALVEELVAAGYAKGHLARALGSRARTPGLQLGRDRLLASTARAVEQLHALLIDPPRRSR